MLLENLSIYIYELENYFPSSYKQLKNVWPIKLKTTVWRLRGKEKASRGVNIRRFAEDTKIHVQHKAGLEKAPHKQTCIPFDQGTLQKKNFSALSLVVTINLANVHEAPGFRIG